MKELITFTPRLAAGHSSEDRGYLAPLLFAELQRRWPQFFPEHPNLMRVEGAMDDPVVNQVISFLRENGREPYWKNYPSCPFEHPHLYPVVGKRVFEPEDHAKAEYFVFMPQGEIAKRGIKEDNGHLRVKRADVRSQLIGDVPSWNTRVCRDSLRKAMEAEKFAGLTFKPAEVIGKKAQDEALWVVTSDRKMPPLLNRTVHEDGTDYVPGTIMGCYVDDFYFPPLFRFSCEQVRKMEPLDVVVTTEHRYPKQGQYFTGDPMKLTLKYDPYIIVSRRFRLWCEKRKLKIEWWPVVLE